MPLLHSDIDIELRTGNICLKLMEEIGADISKTMTVDEITQGRSVNENEDRGLFFVFCFPNKGTKSTVSRGDWIPWGPWFFWGVQTMGEQMARKK